MAIPERRMTIRAIFSFGRGGAIAEAETRLERVATSERTLEELMLRSRSVMSVLAIRGLVGMTTLVGSALVSVGAMVVVVVEDIF